MSELLRKGALLGAAASLAIAGGALAQDAGSAQGQLRLPTPGTSEQPAPWTAPVADVSASPGEQPQAVTTAPVADSLAAAQPASTDPAASAEPAAPAETASAEPAATPASDQQKAVELVSDGVSAKPAGDAACPKVTIAPGGETFPKQEENYKATLEGLARDCANLGAETILKVGLVGQGERDGKNGPSWFNAPIKLSVKDANGADVATRKISLKVRMSSGVMKTSFDHVEENVSLPPVDGGYAGWTVVVGFDPKVSAAAGDDEKVAPAPKRARSVAVHRAHRVARAAPPPPAPRPAAQPAAAPASTVDAQTTNFGRVAQWSKEKQMQTAIEEQKAKQAQARAAQRQPQQAQQRPAAGQPQASATPVPQPAVRTAAAPGAQASVR